MELGDICPYCMRPDCWSVCPAATIAHMAAQTVAEVRTVAPPATLCGFCFGGGGHRVPCHGCRVVGPVMVQR